MPRIWFSGPRLFHGLGRPGISFALSELNKKPSHAKRGGNPAPAPELAAPAAPAHEHIPLHARIIAWVIYGFAIYGFLAHAGTCRVFQDGADAVTACEDSSFTVRGCDGNVRQYGERNGGFERYPGQGARRGGTMHVTNETLILLS